MQKQTFYKIIKWSYIWQWGSLKTLFFLLHILWMLFHTDFFFVVHIKNFRINQVLMFRDKELWGEE